MAVGDGQVDFGFWLQWSMVVDGSLLILGGYGFVMVVGCGGGGLWVLDLFVFCYIVRVFLGYFNALYGRIEYVMQVNYKIVC